MLVIHFLLTVMAAVLYAAGFVSRKVFVEAPSWVIAAIRVGWEDAST